MSTEINNNNASEIDDVDIDEDFNDKDLQTAYDLAEQQLEQCIGHVNDWVDYQYEYECDKDKVDQ